MRLNLHSRNPEITLVINDDCGLGDSILAVCLQDVEGLSSHIPTLQSGRCGKETEYSRRLSYTLAFLETRPGNTKLLHLVDQRSAFQAKFSRCAFRTTNYPADRFKRLQNESAFGLAQRGCTRR